SGTREATRRLISEDSDFESGLETVLDVQEEKGEVSWSDIKTELTSGHWGRLIEKRVLVENEDGEGFVLADEEIVRELL
ncbi:MAG: HTR-like protein, partial [Halobacteria archaeon]|nr:HTR-like protein [Halobacteria archaeon]